jgi:hypothetical protein
MAVREKIVVDYNEKSGYNPFYSTMFPEPALKE